MRTLQHILLAATFIAVISTAQARPIAGVDLPEHLPYAELAWRLTGMGVRTKLMMKLYAAGVYAPPGQSINLNADQAKAMRLHIVSSLITADKLRSAIEEGFVLSTQNNLGPIQAHITQFMQALQTNVQPQDVFDFIYQPQTGVRVYKNQQLKTTIAGAAFQQALFGIWLSDHPVQDSLKTELLTQLR